jgi:hypothetical protein
MKLTHWIALFSIETVLAWWIVFRSGAEKIGSWSSFFLFGVFSDRWSADGFRSFVGLSWIGTLIYFIMGLVQPGLRIGSFLVR